MNVDLWERLIRIFRILVPMASTLVLVCITNAYLPSPSLNAFMPKLVFPAVWFWMLRRPELMHFSMVFILGLVADLLSTNLIGITPLCLLILYRLIAHFDRFFKTSAPLILWSVFAMFVFASLGLEWLTSSILFWTWLDPTNFILKTLTTAIVLPLIIVMLRPLDRLILGAR